MRNIPTLTKYAAIVAAIVSVTTVPWRFSGDLDTNLVLVDLRSRIQEDTKSATWPWSQSLFRGANANDMERRLREFFGKHPQNLQKLFFGKDEGAQPLANILFTAHEFFSATGEAYPPLTTFLKKLGESQITPDVWFGALLTTDATKVAIHTTLNLALTGYMGPYEKLVPMLRPDERLIELLVRFNAKPVPYHPTCKPEQWSLFEMALRLEGRGHPQMLKLIQKVINKADVNALRNVSVYIDRAIENGWQPRRPLTYEELREEVGKIKDRCLTNHKNVAKIYYSKGATTVVHAPDTAKCPQPKKEASHESEIIKRIIFAQPYEQTSGAWPILTRAFFFFGVATGEPRAVTRYTDCVGSAASLLMLLTSHELPEEMEESRFALIMHTSEYKFSHTLLVEAGEQYATVLDAWLGTTKTFHIPRSAQSEDNLTLGKEKKLHSELVRKICHTALGYSMTCVMAMQFWVHTHALEGDWVYDRRRFKVAGHEVTSTMIPFDLSKIRMLNLMVRATMKSGDIERNMLKCRRDKNQSRCHEQLGSGEMKSAAEKTGGAHDSTSRFFSVDQEGELHTLCYKHLGYIW